MSFSNIIFKLNKSRKFFLENEMKPIVVWQNWITLVDYDYDYYYRCKIFRIMLVNKHYYPNYHSIIKFTHIYQAFLFCYITTTVLQYRIGSCCYFPDLSESVLRHNTVQDHAYQHILTEYFILMKLSINFNNLHYFPDLLQCLMNYFLSLWVAQVVYM